MVQLVTAVIQPHRLDDVRSAVEALGVHGVTVTEVRGYGRQRGHTEVYRGAEYAVAFTPKIRLDILVPEDLVESLLSAIETTARTGNIGDGKVWVTDVGAVLRVRTGERGDEAL